MKKIKLFNLLALIFNVIIVGLFAYSFFALIGIKLEALQYFTVLSNALLALIAIICIPFNVYGMVKTKKLNRPIFSLKFMATVAVTTTMLTTICFLLPKNNWDVGFLLGFNNPLTSAEFFMHLVIPTLGLLTFIIFEKRNSDKHLFLLPVLGVLPVFAYGVFYVLDIILKFINPTDWYGFLDGELWIGIIIIALVLIGSYLIGLLILSLNRIGNKDKVEDEFFEDEEKPTFQPVDEVSSDKVEEEIKEENEEIEESTELTEEEEEEEEEAAEEKVEEKEEIPEESEPEEKIERKPQVKRNSSKSKEKKPASSTTSKKPAEKKKPASTKKESSASKGDTKVYHLTKRKEDGMWAITFVGGKKAIKLFKTKKEAEAALKVLTENQGATALIRNSKGAKAGKFASSIKSEDK